MGSALPILGLPSKADYYARALEGLVQVNDLILDKNPGLPPLYAAGVKFKAIPHDNWRRADTIVMEGWSDCEGLSSFRTAELRKGRGTDGVVDPGARVGCYHTGPRKYHAVVVRGDDTIEDPSVLLGMRPRKRMPLTRQEMNVINGLWPRMRPQLAMVQGDDEWSSGVATSFVDNGDGTQSAQVKIPLPSGATLVAQTPAFQLKGILSKPGDYLERPENIAALKQMGPWGKVAASIIENPLARQARQETHALLQKIPGLGRLF
jgi:hypothetical protein